MHMESKKILRVVAVTAGLLLIPLIAMQFTTEVNWQVADFVIAGVLMFIVGFLFELIVSTVHVSRNKVLLIGMLLFVFIYVWAELAVGIFNIPGISGS